MTLFRQKFLDHRNERLFGTVIISQNLSSRLLVVGLVTALFLGAIWVVTGSYARTEQAQGILVTSMPSSKIYAPRAGLIRSLEVREGQMVSEGEEIAIINVDTHNEVGGATAEAALEALHRRIAIAGDQLRFVENRGTAEHARLSASISALTRQIVDVQNQLSTQLEIVSSNRSLFDVIEGIVDRGFVSRVEYERRRQNLLVSRQSATRLEQQLTALQSELTEARHARGQITLQQAQQSSEIETSIEALNQQQAQLEGERAYRIVAPIAGRVTALQAAEGRRAEPDRPLLTIVPVGSELTAIVFAPSRAIGFVEPGQEVRLLYDAFPYQRFGSHGGEIVEVSRIVIDPREADVPFELQEPVYRVKVRLNRQAITGYGEEVPLQPGMTLTANIVLERQSFADWILTPTRAVLNRT